MKVLRTCHAGTAGIFFPIGEVSKGGTCEYASNLCLKECYALKKDYDETLNIPEKEKREILQFFVGNPIVSICSEVIKEVGELQATILTWFASGDCLDVYVDRVYKIMLLLQEEGIVQNGFTRNSKLWQKISQSKDVNYDILRLVLTVEDLDKGRVTPSCGQGAPAAVWAVPDYSRGLVNLYHGRLGYRTYGSCGSGGVTHRFDGQEVDIAANCLGCYKRKIGCFHDPGTTKGKKDGKKKV